VEIKESTDPEDVEVDVDGEGMDGEVRGSYAFGESLPVLEGNPSKEHIETK
jgi:hypothetical protein